MACQLERTNALIGSLQPILLLAHICKNTKEEEKQIKELSGVGSLTNFELIRMA